MEVLLFVLFFYGIQYLTGFRAGFAVLPKKRTAAQLPKDCPLLRSRKGRKLGGAAKAARIRFLDRNPVRCSGNCSTCAALVAYQAA